MRHRLNYANVISTLALFIALGGGAYAAATLPRNSVGTAQLKKNAVNSAKLKSNAVSSGKVKNRSLLARDFKTGQLPAGAKGDPGLKGDAGPATGPAGGDLAGSYPNPTLAAGAIEGPSVFAAGAVPAAKASRSSGVGVTTGSAIPWNNEVLDTAGMWSVGDPTKLVAPVAGLYQVDTFAGMSNLSANALVDLYIRVNGTSVAIHRHEEHGGFGFVYNSNSVLVPLAAGDFVESVLFHNSSTTPSVLSPSSLSMHWVGPR